MNNQLLKFFPLLGAALLSACGLTTYENGQVRPSATTNGVVIGAGAGAALGLAANMNVPLLAAGGGVVGGVVAASMKSAWAAREHLQRAGVQVVQQGEEVSLYIPNDVCFETNTPTLLESCYPVLDQTAVLLKAYSPNVPMTVSGHTDDVGRFAHKKTLSERQAEAVAGYLWSKGVPWRQLKVVADADCDNIASNRYARGSAFNRRVQIDIRPNLAPDKCPCIPK